MHQFRCSPRLAQPLSWPAASKAVTAAWKASGGVVTWSSSWKLVRCLIQAAQLVNPSMIYGGWLMVCGAEELLVSTAK